MLCLEGGRTGGIFLRGGGGGIACPGFSVHFFRLGVSKQNGIDYHWLRPPSIGIHAESG